MALKHKIIKAIKDRKNIHESVIKDWIEQVELGISYEYSEKGDPDHYCGIMRKWKDKRRHFGIKKLICLKPKGHEEPHEDCDGGIWFNDKE